MYAETSSGTSGGSRSQGDLHTLAYDGSTCTKGTIVKTISFEYHMYGSYIGQLTVMNDATAGGAVWSALDAARCRSEPVDRFGSLGARIPIF